VGLMSCCTVVVALNAIPMLVFLNGFVIHLIFGLWDVNVIQIVLCFVPSCVRLILFCIWWLIF